MVYARPLRPPGRPNAGVVMPKAQVITEATGKKIKLIQAIAMLAVIVGGACILAGIPMENTGLIRFGIIAFVPGVAVAIVMRIVRWWSHG